MCSKIYFEGRGDIGRRKDPSAISPGRQTVVKAITTLTGPASMTISTILTGGTADWAKRDWDIPASSVLRDAGRKVDSAFWLNGIYALLILQNVDICMFEDRQKLRCGESTADMKASCLQVLHSESSRLGTINVRGRRCFLWETGRQRSKSAPRWLSWRCISMGYVHKCCLDHSTSSWLSEIQGV